MSPVVFKTNYQLNKCHTRAIPAKYFLINEHSKLINEHSKLCPEGNTLKGMAIPRPRLGRLWGDSEAEKMLLIRGELEGGPKVMPSTHNRTISFFNRVSRSLGESGFVRTEEMQCHAKVKRKKEACILRGSGGERW